VVSIVAFFLPNEFDSRKSLKEKSKNRSCLPVTDPVAPRAELERRVLDVVDADVANVLLLHAERRRVARPRRQLDVVLGREKVDAVAAASAMTGAEVDAVSAARPARRRKADRHARRRLAVAVAHLNRNVASTLLECFKLLIKLLKFFKGIIILHQSKSFV